MGGCDVSDGEIGNWAGYRYAYRSVAVSTLLSFIVLARAVWFNGPNFPDTLTYAEKEPHRNVSVVIESLMKSIMKYAEHELCEFKRAP